MSRTAWIVLAVVAGLAAVVAIGYFASRASAQDAPSTGGGAEGPTGGGST